VSCDAPARRVRPGAPPCAWHARVRVCARLCVPQAVRGGCASAAPSLALLHTHTLTHNPHMHAHTHTHAHPPTHTHTHTRAQTHTQRQRRCGRAARAGRPGCALSLLTRDELPYLLDLHLYLGRTARPAPLAPQPADVAEAAAALAAAGGVVAAAAANAPGVCGAVSGAVCGARTAVWRRVHCVHVVRASMQFTRHTRTQTHRHRHTLHTPPPLHTHTPTPGRRPQRQRQRQRQRVAVWLLPAAAAGPSHRARARRGGGPAGAVRHGALARKRIRTLHQDAARGCVLWRVARVCTSVCVHVCVCVCARIWRGIVPAWALQQLATRPPAPRHTVNPKPNETLAPHAAGAAASSESVRRAKACEREGPHPLLLAALQARSHGRVDMAVSVARCGRCRGRCCARVCVCVRVCVRARMCVGLEGGGCLCVSLRSDRSGRLSVGVCVRQTRCHKQPPHPLPLPPPTTTQRTHTHTHTHTHHSARTHTHTP
jgi:hypothetical protein